MELCAEFSFVIIGQMHLFHKLMVTVCEGTLVQKLAFLVKLPVPAHFGFEFDLV